MDHNEDMEKVLAKRFTPAMREDLPERIIASSQKRGAQNRGGTIWLIIMRDGLLVPKPLFACIVIFALGLVMGLLGSNLAFDDAGLYMSDLVFTAEQVSEGDWL
ncbi:MAG: hypothetical protein ACLFR0_07370 [Alphaproteobacteria bacterium]